ncbi:PAS domain S-box protein [Mucilaginibacter gotjawali]|uniref:histidine kinase n=2 Tax=Mucilaginibacter gotjawali TaxID=1550579 RepID=A0A110B3X4_9SPHI|nr:PAS domain S-box protein [Mucilaginibacter gotjawali]MBB3055289.1 PAS domain S-box-containing protein [Mucilaginibacter gotjawali]BAU56093.1 Sensor histidine kinase YycG [Mucilaginibacter gotjawali]
MQITPGDELFQLAQTAPIGICILDAATLTCEIVNGQFLTIAGKPLDAIKGKHYWDAFAEVRVFYEAALAGVVSTGNVYSANEVEMTLIRHGREETMYVTFVYSPVKNSEGKVIKVAVWVLDNTLEVLARQKSAENALALQAVNERMADINEELNATNSELENTIEELAAINEELASTNDELTQTRDELQRSENLFRSIATNIPNSIVVVIDREHRYIIVEGDLMERLGYNRTDYEGKHPTELGQTERYLAVKHLYDRMMAGEKFSLERSGAGGETYMVHFVPLKNEYGGVDAGIIMAIDVTELKHAEEKSAKLAAIVQSSDDAIISKTLESVITSWNDSAQRIFGYKAEEIIGQTIYKLIPPDRQDEEPRILQRLKKGERVEHFETQRLTKDGRLLDVSLSISPLKDGQGNIIGLSKIVRDITERKLDEARKNDFIGMASHELKTPLTSLHAIIQVANAKLKNSDDKYLAHAMEKANMQVKRMTRMINGFLNISRLESGKLIVERQSFDMGQLIREILDETSLTVSTHTISLQSTAPAVVTADRDKISSVLSNLISNAVKYSPAGGTIAIDYQLAGQTLTVSVKDQGMGISPGDLDKIFERYYRVEAAEMRNISGFGIGLYLSAEIIKRHNGTIRAESSEGEGSVFSFTLPVD